MKEIIKTLMTNTMMGMKNIRTMKEIIKITALAVTVNIIMALRKKEWEEESKDKSIILLCSSWVTVMVIIINKL